MILPTEEECLKIMEEANVPDNIKAHCRAVADFAMRAVDFLQKRDVRVNRDLVLAGALLHDIKKMSPNDHVVEGAEYVRSLGFLEVGNIIRKHGLAHLDNEEFVPKTTEEKIVFYADKRVKNDKVVSVEERFRYIREKYDRQETEPEYRITKEIEKELFGDVFLEEKAEKL